jgi:hypothetical protein
MTTLLLDIKKAVDEAEQQSQSHLALEPIREFETRYDVIIAQGLQQNPPPS